MAGVILFLNCQCPAFTTDIRIFLGKKSARCQGKGNSMASKTEYRRCRNLVCLVRNCIHRSCPFDSFNQDMVTLGDCSDFFSILYGHCRRTFDSVKGLHVTCAVQSPPGFYDRFAKSSLCNARRCVSGICVQELVGLCV